MIFWVLYLVAIYAGMSLFVPEIRELVITAAILFSPLCLGLLLLFSRENEYRFMVVISFLGSIVLLALILAQHHLSPSTRGIAFLAFVMPIAFFVDRTIIGLKNKYMKRTKEF